ncbi:uncharacterized protein LOC131803481 [Musca domestica]|uniref:Uncharacterized protein LOC131803481 n=1 Tax=Musca domestica TaxID=7370 RepID=A0ABM3V4W2_MUSDO|nr:uncharacterized protein LOC131803481 [Musca domestica]
MTIEDDWCMQRYNETTVVEDEGRIVVSLPLKDDKSLGDSKGLAIVRLLSIEKKLRRNPNLDESYEKFMKEYEELGPMEKVSAAVEGKYNLPHHSVVREGSITTKVRVVFDASAKSTNGKSLNDIMYTGPKLQRDIFDIMLQWRMWCYGITADVEKCTVK